MFITRNSIVVLKSNTKKLHEHLKMQCRACLTTSCENTTRLDEHSIMYFNLITDISIHMEDSLPQRLCENCTKDLQFCVKFREKCVTSNSILVGALTSIEGSKVTTQIKQEDDLESDEISYTKLDEKVDIEIKSEYNNLQNHETLQIEDNFVYEYKSDVKQPNIEDSPTQTSVSSKEKTRKMAPKRTRKMASRAVKEEINTSNKNKNVSKLIKFDCGLCAEKVEKDKLCDHVKSHAANNYCGICSLYLKDWETMLYHRISHLQKPNFICHTCLRVFQTPLSLEYHYNVKLLGNIIDGAKGWECNKDNVTLQNSKKQRRYMHNDTKKTYKCKDCSEVFRNNNTLRYHKMKSHVNKNKVWFCNECDYKSKSNCALREHKLRIHTAEKARCKLCKVLFKDESRLKLHKCQYSTHSICPVCGIVIKVPGNMKRHLASHSDERKYKCGRCDAAYKTRDSLSVHLSKHDGVRAYKCEYCPATFWANPTLIKHRRVHTGEKPYVCKVCNKGFTANHNLKVHMKVHGVFNLIKKKGTKEETIIQQSNKSSPMDFPNSV